MVMSNIYLTDDVYSDDALNENFQLVVSDLKNRIINRDTVITIALINQLLPVGYNRAKQIFIKLKKEGYLDELGRLLFDDYPEDRGSRSDTKEFLKSVYELCVDNAYSKIPEDLILQRDSLFISSGFPKLDKLIHGFEKGKLYMIAGRPGYGKSVFALNLALNIASNPFVDKSVLYVSTELDMSEQVFSDRLTANLTQVSIDDIKSGNKLSAQDSETLLKNLKQFNTVSSNGNCLSKLYFSFTDGVDISSIMESISLLTQSERGISCLIVDPVFLHPVSPGTYKRNLKSLKALAQKLNIPVIVISLTSRAAEKRVNSEWEHPSKQKPILEDICFSSIVKEYADVVLLLERSIYRTAVSYELKSKVELTAYSNRKKLGRHICFNFRGNFLKIY